MSKRNKRNQQPQVNLPTIKPTPLQMATEPTKQVVFTTTHIQHQHTSGLLPPPAMLAEYEKIQVGLAERMMKMSEDEAGHRRNVEIRIIGLQSDDQKAYRRSELIGQICGLLIAIGSLVAAGYMTSQGQPTAASVTATAGVSGVVTAFIIGRKTLADKITAQIKAQQESEKQQTKAA